MAAWLAVALSPASSGQIVVVLLNLGGYSVYRETSPFEGRTVRVEGGLNGKKGG